MFILTAKLNKKKILSVLLALAAIAAVIAVVICLVRGGEKSVSEINSADDAAKYLSSLGWRVDPTPIDVQEIVIPREFSDVYERYIALQEAQGFDLKKYGGMKATRYTFTVLNYPSGENGIVADLVVFGSSIIAGDIQSTALNGFMEGLCDNLPAAPTATVVPTATVAPSAAPTAEPTAEPSCEPTAEVSPDVSAAPTGAEGGAEAAA